LLEAGDGPVTLGGYIGDPSCDRGSSQLEYLFRNGRWVRDRGLFQAVQDAYRGLLLTGRYPVAFLILEVPPEQVDVNVHPTKAEVRFRDPETVYQLVQAAVRARLQKADLTARLLLRTGKEPPAEAAGSARTGRELDAAPQSMPAAARSTAPTPPRSTAAATTNARGTVPLAPAGWFAPATVQTPPVQGQSVQVCDSFPTAPAQPAEARALQVLDCYLVVEVPPDAVWFLDQHALHEAILFAQLQQRLRAGTLESQRLLLPETVTLPATQAAAVLGQRQALAELGLLVEDFGGGTLLLSGYPALLDKRSPRTVLQAVVEHLASRERAPSREQLCHDLLSVMACHAAVRAGDRLTAAEIAALLAQRHLAADSHHCPHGRPTGLRFTRHDLDRQFRRTQ
jgi:DNA mismatch repair protein MutL